MTFNQLLNTATETIEYVNSMARMCKTALLNREQVLGLVARMNDGEISVGQGLLQLGNVLDVQAIHISEKTFRDDRRKQGIEMGL
jgi:hypothetical protein